MGRWVPGTVLVPAVGTVPGTVPPGILVPVVYTVRTVALWGPQISVFYHEVWMAVSLAGRKGTSATTGVRTPKTAIDNNNNTISIFIPLQRFLASYCRLQYCRS
jgi:hypothetical protein